MGGKDERLILSISRRSMLGLCAYAGMGMAVGSFGLDTLSSAKRRVALVVAPTDKIATSMPGQWALNELKEALTRQGVEVRMVERLADAKLGAFCVVLSDMKAPLASILLERSHLAPPNIPESLCLLQQQHEGRTILLAAGVDPTGLAYALTELADRVNCPGTGRNALLIDQPVVEQPASRIRSVMSQFVNEATDKKNFYDKAYWKTYLDILAYSRMNCLSFTTGMGVNGAAGITDGYFIFPYPFLVDVPGYKVTAEGLSSQEREKNLAMLRWIGEETTKRGIQFHLGLWSVAYEWKNSPKATYRPLGLTDETHARYCRDALSLILKEVPTISGVTFRVHRESGIAKGSEDFWKVQFDALKECGRRVSIDLHGKELEQETLDLAVATGQQVMISPKYCGEHLGLPYHQCDIRHFEIRPPKTMQDTGAGLIRGDRKFTRYGYSDYFAENRNWDVLIRIWPGDRRFLLGADPVLFAGYARQASFCGAEGIEITEPLGFKGRNGSGHEGSRTAYIDESLIPAFDFQKYTYFHRLWGRLCYNPDTPPDVWERALRVSFGSASVAVAESLAAITPALPLMTLAHAPSGGCDKYLPEIPQNIPIADPDYKPHFHEKVAGFGEVSPFDPQLFMSCNECADGLLGNTPSAKYTPIEVAAWLEQMSTRSSSALIEAYRLIGDKARDPEFRRIEEDVLIQQGYARFFAQKLRAAVLWRIYEKSGNLPAAKKAIELYEEGINIWTTMAERAANIYHQDIAYGSRHVGGHWKDRTPAFRKDVNQLKEQIKEKVVPENIDINAVASAIRYATTNPQRPSFQIAHTPAPRFVKGQPLDIAFENADGQIERAVLHYRVVNHAQRWKTVELVKTGTTFAGAIPADYTDTRYPLQYYVEVLANGKATYHPALASHLSNQPYYVVSLER